MLVSYGSTLICLVRVELPRYLFPYNYNVTLLWIMEHSFYGYIPKELYLQIWSTININGNK